MNAKLEGRWQMVRAELAGEAAPELVTTKTEVRLQAGRYEVRYDGEVADSGGYLEAGEDGRRTLLLEGWEGTNAGRTIPCLFQLMGDRLRVCYGLDGALPQEFSARAGEARFVAVYRRIAGV